MLAILALGVAIVALVIFCLLLRGRLRRRRHTGKRAYFSVDLAPTAAPDPHDP